MVRRSNKLIAILEGYVALNRYRIVALKLKTKEFFKATQ
jgi:hypothetical protein